MQESKENQPESFGDAPVTKENQPNNFGEDAPATRREMETWERDGRIEMEKRESATSGTSSWKCSVNSRR